MSKSAFLFAGQGAQKPGMAMELKDNKKVAELFEKANATIPGIIDLIANGTPEELGITINTQPAMMIADLAYAYASDITPSAVCGFSVGEVPALAYAGAFSVEDGLKIIKKRAELMHEASQLTSGGMVAVLGLEANKVQAIVDKVEGSWTANFNSVMQTVVAVTDTALEPLLASVKENGGKAIKLKVSGAFHCPLLKDASDKLAEFIKTIKVQKPTLDVYANTTALPYATDDIASMLQAQMCGAVKFTDIIANMKKAGITDFVEVGPGGVLAGLVSKIAIGK